MDKLHVNLQEQRKKKGLSQADVAEHLHISRQAISQWETGKTQPDIGSLQALCNLYGLSVSEMLGEENVQTTNTSQEKKVTDEKVDFSTLVRILIIAVILALASQIAVLGIVIAIGVIIWTIKNKPKMRSVIILICLIALLVSISNTYGVLSYYFLPNAGSGTIEKLS